MTDDTDCANNMFLLLPAKMKPAQKVKAETRILINPKYKILPPQFKWICVPMNKEETIELNQM